MPFINGSEGAGEVVAVGPGVTDVKVGDRVGYTSAHDGYTAERMLPAERLVKLPDSISYEQAAGMMLKGMTVEYLMRRTFKVEKGTNVLIHAAAGGVGLIACQWANYLGANVIGTVGSKDKARARQGDRLSPHHPLPRGGLRAPVKDITDGELCDVVYDGVGKATFPASLDCIHPLGMWVTFGNASGSMPPFNMQPAAEGLAVLHAADARPLCRQARGPAVDRQQPVQRGGQRQGEDPGQPDLRAQGRRARRTRTSNPARPRGRRCLSPDGAYLKFR